MTKTQRRWLTAGLRYGLCVVAIAILAYKVPWHSQIRLGDKDGPLVRLVETPIHSEDAAQFQIDRGNGPEWIPASAVYRPMVDNRPVPEIDLGILDVVRTMSRRLALYAVLLFAPVWFLQSYRLVVMVAIQGVRLSYWNAIKLTFAGNFFNFALPGTTGGDLIKAYYLTLYTHLKTEVVTTVFLDRAIGLLGLVLLAAVGMVVRWNPERFFWPTLFLGLLCVGLAIPSLFVFSSRLRTKLGLSRIAARLPKGDHLLRIGRATLALRANKLGTLLSLLLTLMLQAVVLISAGVMGWALGMHGPDPASRAAELWYFAIYVAIGFLIAAIPSTPMAFGVMELFYIRFFTQSGLNTASQALAFALAVRLIQLVWAVPGVLVPLFGAHLPRKGELAELEREADADRDDHDENGPDEHPGAERTAASGSPAADPT